jgi:hypothetical protein
MEEGEQERKFSLSIYFLSPSKGGDEIAERADGVVSVMIFESPAEHPTILYRW